MSQTLPLPEVFFTHLQRLRSISDRRDLQRLVYEEEDINTGYLPVAPRAQYVASTGLAAGDSSIHCEEGLN